MVFLAIPFCTFNQFLLLTKMVKHVIWVICDGYFVIFSPWVCTLYIYIFFILNF